MNIVNSRGKELNSTFEICGLKVEPGSRSKGILLAGPYFYPPCNQKIRKYVRIPFTVIRGAYDGPILCITGGVHPTEYVNIAGAIRLSNEVDPKELKGTLIIVPVVNILGFKQREYVNPVDGLNLQGQWPGKDIGQGRGTISHMILYKIFNELISKADHYLDLHGSDVHETMLLMAAFHKTGNSEIDKKSEGMARATGAKYISCGSSSPGAGTRCMAERGIASAAFELGTGDRMLTEEVERSFQILINVMRYLKMIEGEPSKTEGQMIVPAVKTYVNHEGLFYPQVKLGDFVSEGQVLGEIKNLFGEVIETVHAPSNGTITYWIHNPMVEAGQNVLTIKKEKERI